jgi:hypothetical protein
MNRSYSATLSRKESGDKSLVTEDQVSISGIGWIGENRHDIIPILADLSDTQ